VDSGRFRLVQIWMETPVQLKKRVLRIWSLLLLGVARFWYWELMRLYFHFVDLNLANESTCYLIYVFGPFCMVLTMPLMLTLLSVGFRFSSFGIFVEAVTDLVKFSLSSNSNWENKVFSIFLSRCHSFFSF